VTNYLTGYRPIAADSGRYADATTDPNINTNPKLRPKTLILTTLAQTIRLSYREINTVGPTANDVMC